METEFGSVGENSGDLRGLGGGLTKFKNLKKGKRERETGEDGKGQIEGKKKESEVGITTIAKRSF